MNKITRDNNFFNVLFGFDSKEKEEEYKYFYYLNIFKSTKNIILIASIIYFALGVMDIFFTDINFIVIAIVKISVSLFGFTLVFSNILQIKRINILVPIFYISAMIGITVQVFYNTNSLFFTYYSAGLLSIMTVFLLMSGVNLVNSIISNTSVIIIYMYVLSTKLSIEYFLGHLSLIILGNLVAIVATYLNERSNRGNYILIKLIEQTNNDKLSNEIKQKQEILKQLQELNDHNKELQRNLDKISIENKGDKNNIENEKLSSLIKSINKVKNNTNTISSTLDTVSINNYTIDELKQANYDLSRMLSEMNKSGSSVKLSDVHKEQFNLNQFIKDVQLVINFSSKEDKLDFILDKKLNKPCVIISDQVKLKQIFISLLFYFYNNGIRKVNFTFDRNQNNEVEFEFKVEQVNKEFNFDITKTLIPTYIEFIGGVYNITNDSINIVLKNKEIKKENKKDYSITFNKEYVLIIDDDNENLSYIEYVIKNFNANILKATDGIEAMNLFKKYNEKIEIVIMDVNMPGLNGNDAAKYMKDINPKVPILLVTAYSHYKEHINNGDKLLLKPFTPKVLVENISALVN